MKKLLSLSIIMFLLLSCDNIKTVIDDINTKIQNKQNLAIRETKSEVVYTETGDKTKITRSYCKIIRDIDERITNPKIYNPVDVAVTKDGSTMYVVTSGCGLPKELNYERCNEKGTNIFLGKFIYKIDTKTKKVKVLKIDDNYSLSCHLGNEIEIDSNNNLYVTNAITGSIYKISNENKIEKIFDLDFPLETPLSEEPVSSENLSIKNNFLYFFKRGIKRINLKTKDYSYENVDPLKLDLLTELLQFNINSNTFIESCKDTTCVYLYVSIPISPESAFAKEVTLTIIKKSKDFFSLIENPLSKIFHIRRYQDVIVRENLKGDLIVNNKIASFWKIKVKDKTIEPFVGTNGTMKSAYIDGIGEESEFAKPQGMSFDAQDNLYVADTGNNAIRKITPQGEVSTLYKEKE